MKLFQTKRGAAGSSSQNSLSEPSSGSSSPTGDDFSTSGQVKGSLLTRSGFGRWKPFWYEQNGDSLMQFPKRGANKPTKVFRLTAAILKRADDLTGEPFSLAVFIPQKDPLFFRALNEEQRTSWMAALAKHCASTEWSTSSMVTAFVDPVCVASQEGVILEVNDALLKMFGYERKAVIGKNVKMLMPQSVAQHHDQYMRSFVETGIAKLVGKPRSLLAQHSDGSAIPIVLSLGVERAEDGKKTFIATLRADKEKKQALTRVELETMMQKTVESSLQEAATKIKSGLQEELEAIMKRLEEYQAQQKLSAARGLKSGSGSGSGSASEHAGENDESDVDSVALNTTRPGKHAIEVDGSNIAVGPPIAVGGSGNTVYSCNVDGWECAMKELKIASAKQSDIDAFMAEIFMLESLPPHKNLVRFLFHEKKSDRIRIFMRRYEGTLDTWLAKRKDKDEFLELADVARLSLDVVRALEILHDYKIIHRDVKSKNLFINHDMAGNLSHLTLSDFDAAKVVENDGAAKTIIGTIGWMPPEVFSSQGKSYSFSADVWSFGCVMFELMDLGRPFSDIDEFDRAAYIGAGHAPNFRNPDFASKKYARLIPIWKKCMALRPEDRPLLKEIKVELSQFL